MDFRFPVSDFRFRRDALRAAVSQASGLPRACPDNSSPFSESADQRSATRQGAGLRYGLLLVFSILLLGCASALFAEQRFPPPDFEGGHQIPVTTTPPARSVWLAYVDVAVLTAALGTAAWLIYKKRSRKALIALSLFSLAYFGFYRKGCVCSIGSVQNVALALFGGAQYAVPVAALAFFILPLVFSLFAGRAFCAGVCPHGALQDLVLLKPVKLPLWLEQGLSVLPFIYLGAGVMFAATGSMFIFCQYDPFVPLFRLSGRTLMVLSGVGLLLLGTFVGRPYCRFFCPFGALLKMGSTVAKLRVRVTPDVCTQCRLCEASCPYGAMREPQAPATTLPSLKTDRRRLACLLVFAPVLILSFGWLGFRFSIPASKVHPTVKLAEQFIHEQNTPAKTGVLSPDDLALERARQTPGEILNEAVVIRKKFRTGGWLFGGWVGLVLAAKLVSLSLHRRRTDYEPDRGDCVACGRCFEFCPNELVRRGAISPGRAAEMMAHSSSAKSVPAREEVLA